jgi:hypothetical protein
LELYFLVFSGINIEVTKNQNIMHNSISFGIALIFFLIMGCKADKPDPCQLECDDPDSGIVLHYSFDEQSGTTATDCTSNQMNGILHGAKWALADGRHSSVEFDGNDTLDIPLTTTGAGWKFDPASGTISVTFKFRNSDGDIEPIVYFGESDAGSPHNSLIIEVGHKMDVNDRKLYFTIVNKRFCFDSNKNLEENKWYHFVAVVSTAGNTGYLNGVEMTDRHYNLGSDSTYTEFFQSVPAKEIFTLGYGRYGMCDDFFFLDGYISDFRVYNRALSAAEIQELYGRVL